MNMIKKITSMQNQTLKNVRALEQRKTRKEKGLFLAEGLKVIATAQDCNWAPKILIFEEGTAERGISRQLVDWALDMGAEVIEVPYDLMGRLSSRDNPQSMMAVFEQRWRQLPPNAREDEFWIGLEEVRDPGNLGTIIRTADAAGASGVILIGTCCDAYSLESVRATMGSVFAMPIARASTDAFVEWRKKVWHGRVIATHLEASDDYRREYGQGPHMLLMGSEGPGLTDKLVKLATHKVKIPMKGMADSLNLSVATGLMIYKIQGL